MHTRIRHHVAWRWRTIGNVRVGLTRDYELYRRFLQSNPTHEAAEPFSAANPHRPGISAKAQPGKEKILVFLPREANATDQPRYRAALYHEVLHGFQSILARKIGIRIYKDKEFARFTEGLFRSIEPKKRTGRHNSTTLKELLPAEQPFQVEDLKSALNNAYPNPRELRIIAEKMIDNPVMVRALKTLNNEHPLDPMDNQAIMARQTILRYFIQHAPKKS